MSKDDPEMTASDVIEIAQLLDQNRIDVWIDGGWGVDHTHSIWRVITFTESSTRPNRSPGPAR